MQRTLWNGALTLLIGFGLAYMVWGIVRGRRAHRHSHLHHHDDGTVHLHEHDHQQEHVHVHAAAGDDKPGKMTTAAKTATVMGLFVVFILALLVVFLPPADQNADGTAIFIASEFVGDTLPWLLLFAAIGSQTSAIIGATSSRSDMLVHHKVSRKLTFPIILVPAILLVLLVDVNVAVNLASRVFAAYFTIQASLATLLAARKKNWPAVAGFVAVALAMLVILIFGLPL